MDLSRVEPNTVYLCMLVPAEISCWSFSIPLADRHKMFYILVNLPEKSQHDINDSSLHQVIIRTHIKVPWLQLNAVIIAETLEILFAFTLLLLSI